MLSHILLLLIRCYILMPSSNRSTNLPFITSIETTRLSCVDHSLIVWFTWVKTSRLRWGDLQTAAILKMMTLGYIFDLRFLKNSPLRELILYRLLLAIQLSFVMYFILGDNWLVGILIWIGVRGETCVTWTTCSVIRLVRILLIFLAIEGLFIDWNNWLLFNLSILFEILRLGIGVLGLIILTRAFRVAEIFCRLFSDDIMLCWCFLHLWMDQAAIKYLLTSCMVALILRVANNAPNLPFSGHNALVCCIWLTLVH